MLHAARWKCRTQKSRQKSPSGHHPTTLSGYIFATKACMDNRKKILKHNISSTRPRNMVNFGPLAAEIFSLVWGTPSNFNGFRVLAALLHGTLVVGVSQTAALNSGRHLYSAGRPSRWALAHISSSFFFMVALCNRTDHYIFVCFFLLLLLSLWSPYVIGQPIIFLPCDFYLLSFFLLMVALCNRADHNIFIL